MPVRKYIDKKNAVTFQVVHRSQKDPLVADETAPQHVLVPFGSKKEEKGQKDATSEKIDPKTQQIEYGIYFDDDYDYLKHMKPVSDMANVEWAPIPGKSEAPKKENLKEIKLRLPSSVFESEIEEEVGMLNKAAPHSGPRLDYDPDIVAAMDEDFDFQNDANLLRDDFMKFANSTEPIPDATDADDENDADWEDADSNEGTLRDDDSDSDRFPDDDNDDPFKEEETRSRFTSYSLTSSVVRRTKMLTLLDDRFEKIYEQYDDTEVGALDDEDIEGYLSLKDNRLLTMAAEFEQQLDDDRLIGSNMITAPKDDIVIIDAEVEEEEEDSDPFATSSDDDERFDCVSILTQTPRSEYMPTMIDVPSNKPPKIRISARTGMPLDVLGKRGLTKANLAELDRFSKPIGGRLDDFEDETESILSTLSILSLRAKNETPEDRKARKQALREYRKERRNEKKANTLAFKDEKKRQEKVMRNQKVTSGVKII